LSGKPGTTHVSTEKPLKMRRRPSPGVDDSARPEILSGQVRKSERRCSSPALAAALRNMTNIHREETFEPPRSTCATDGVARSRWHIFCFVIPSSIYIPAGDRGSDRRAATIERSFGVAASSLSLLHSLLSASAVVKFVPQADRRQLADRRRGWRGGRRISDFTQFVQPDPAHDAAHDAQARRTRGADAFLL